MLEVDARFMRLIDWSAKKRVNFIGMEWFETIFQDSFVDMFALTDLSKDYKRLCFQSYGAFDCFPDKQTYSMERSNVGELG